jgi:antitoxin CptB
MTEESISIGRLRWRCRRGTKELDRILGGYLDQDYAQAPLEQQRAFAALLEVQDPDIYDWLMGVQTPNKATFKVIIGLLRDKYQISSMT